MNPANEFRQKVTCALLDCRSHEQHARVALKLLHESEDIIDGWEAENARLKRGLGEIANSTEYLSLKLNLRESSMTINQWAKAVLDGNLKWDRGFMIIEPDKPEGDTR